MELITILTKSFEATVEQKRIQTSNSYQPNPVFLSINSKNEVSEHKFISEAVTPHTKYVIGCLRDEYNDFGWKNNYGVFVIVDKTGQIMEFEGEKWVLKNFKFDHNAVGYLPRPKATLALKSDLQQTIELFSYEIEGLQPFWTLFSELNLESGTIKEAELYMKYFLVKLKHNNTSLEFQKFKDDLENKNEIIEKYEELLKSIEEMISRSSD